MDIATINVTNLKNTLKILIVRARNETFAIYLRLHLKEWVNKVIVIF